MATVRIAFSATGMPICQRSLPIDVATTTLPPLSAGEDDHRRVGAATHRVAEPDTRALHLARTRVAAELAGELDHLTERGRAEGLALRQQSAARVDRQPAGHLGHTLVGQLPGVAAWAQAELFV